MSAVHDRVTSAAGVSVGTSISLEAVLSNWPTFDEERKIAFTDIKEFNQFYINVETLFRNLISSIDGDSRFNLNTTEVGEALAEECRAIKEAVTANSAGVVKTVFYHCTYKDIQTKFVSDKLYKPTTPRQIYYADLQAKVIKYLKQALHTPQQNEGVVEYNTSMVPAMRGKTLMMTHYPVDLLSHEKFGTVTLLESYTALLKNRNQWHTKLHDGKNLSAIPFGPMSIQVFGDDSHFRPLDKKVKQAIIELAEKNKWTWMTSEFAQKNAIRTLPDQFFAQMLLRMY